MEWDWAVFWRGLLIISGIGVLWLGRRFWQDVRVERARELFVLQQGRLHEMFALLAGLENVDWPDTATLVLRQTPGQELAGLVAMRLSGDSQISSALFLYHRGQWGTDGRYFRHQSPAEVAKNHQQTWRLIHSSA